MPAVGDLLEPQEIEVPLPDGSTKKYLLSKFPAVQGREIICKYPLSGMPKLGDYEINKETMLKLMSYVAVPAASPIRLSTIELINNHVKSWETLMLLEIRMIEYNSSFFLKGRLSSFFDDIAKKLPEQISKILTASLERLSPQAKPPSTNSEQSTA